MALTASLTLVSFAMIITDIHDLEALTGQSDAASYAHGQADALLYQLTQAPSRRGDKAGQSTMQVIRNGGLLCSWNKGSCRRSVDARVRFWPPRSDTTFTLTLGAGSAGPNAGPCIPMKWSRSWSSGARDKLQLSLRRRRCARVNPKPKVYFSAVSAPGLCKAAPLREADALRNLPRGRSTLALLYLWVMQGMSNGGLLCSGSMGSCRRRSDAGQEVLSTSCRRCCARVNPKPKVLLGPWLVQNGPIVGSRCVAQFAKRPLCRMAPLYFWVMHGMSNRGLLCSWNMGSCRRRSDAGQEVVSKWRLLHDGCQPNTKEPVPSPGYADISTACSRLHT